MTNNDFRNPSSQAERREMLKQDREASMVRYPAASGPWSRPQPGPEEPLGR
jgi:hypothetical protein